LARSSIQLTRSGLISCSFELAFAVPPAVGQRFELGDFGAVDVAH